MKTIAMSNPPKITAVVLVREPWTFCEKLQRLSFANTTGAELARGLYEAISTGIATQEGDDNA